MRLSEPFPAVVGRLFRLALIRILEFLIDGLVLNKKQCRPATFPETERIFLQGLLDDRQDDQGKRRRRTLRPFFTADRRFPAVPQTAPKPVFMRPCRTAFCRKRFAFPLLFVILLHHGSRIMSTRFLPFEAGPRAEQARIRARFCRRCAPTESRTSRGFHAVAVHVVYYSYF